VITREVLEHHAASEIIAALGARDAAGRLRQRAHVRLTCLRVGGKIVVQAPG